VRPAPYASSAHTPFLETAGAELRLLPTSAAGWMERGRGPIERGVDLVGRPGAGADFKACRCKPTVHVLAFELHPGHGPSKRQGVSLRLFGSPACLSQSLISAFRASAVEHRASRREAEAAVGAGRGPTQMGLEDFCPDVHTRGNAKGISTIFRTPGFRPAIRTCPLPGRQDFARDSRPCVRGGPAIYVAERQLALHRDP